VGNGRLTGLEQIVEPVVKLTHLQHDLKEPTILITAGPTCEDIDPVRYITNRSSGKMGYQLAAASQSRGAQTILVSGPTHLDPPAKVELVTVRSASEMREKVLQNWSRSSILVKAAAVVDFKPREFSAQKIKKNLQGRCLDLVPTPDILSELGRQKGDRILVGFAAETEKVLENARNKLKEKNLDLIIVNDVTQEGIGFDSDANAVTILTRDGKEFNVTKRSKREVANEILDYIVALKNRHG